MIMQEVKDKIRLAIQNIMFEEAVKLFRELSNMDIPDTVKQQHTNEFIQLKDNYMDRIFDLLADK